jgi:hypothetical protein
MAAAVSFQNAYEQWLAAHVKKRAGERRRRLEEGHGHAERLFVDRVWYPLFGGFDHLHPEYELVDFGGNLRFVDFAWIRDTVKLAIEIDGFSAHASNLSRRQFDDNLMRQNHLVIDGWHVLRFSCDMVRDQPRLCQQVVQQFFGKIWTLGVTRSMDGMSADELLEREVIRLALREDRPLHPIDVRRQLKISEWQTRHLLKRLVAKGLLEPLRADRQRIHCYRLIRTQLTL